MPEKSYKNYLLFMLVLVAAFSYFDRFVFALALEPIKQDLNLSDSQLGLMTGIAFAAVYAVAGIPIARWADHGNRVSISSLAVGLLGLTVSLCAFVSSFFQLLLVRSGVAVGEAGTVPAAQSLISDYFSRSERPHALAIYFMSYPVSMIIGYLVGGWLIDAYGWRVTFFIVGIPAFVVALIAKLTLREPREKKDKRLSKSENNSSAVQSETLLSTLRELWEIQSFRYMLFAFCVGYFFFMGVSQWLATFFIRSHGMSSSELGAWLALVWGVFGIVGNYLGGYICNRFASSNEKMQFRLVAILFIVNVPVSALCYLVVDKDISLALVALTAVLTTFGNGPVFAAVQSIVEENKRAMAVAVLFLFANLVGFGLGPFFLGLISDALEPVFGSDSLRYALVAFSPGGVWIAMYYWRCSSIIKSDIQKVTVEIDLPSYISREDHGNDQLA